MYILGTYGNAVKLFKKERNQGTGDHEIQDTVLPQVGKARGIA